VSDEVSVAREPVRLFEQVKCPVGLMFGISGEADPAFEFEGYLSWVAGRGCGSCGKRRRVLAGVFQVVWEGAGSSRLSIRRQLP
jgi:hypothetical protein